MSGGYLPMNSTEYLVGQRQTSELATADALSRAKAFEITVPRRCDKVAEENGQGDQA